MEMVKSFQINHLKLMPGLYVSRVDQFVDARITTFDLRFVSPNSEVQKPLSTAALHTIEHIGATYLRNDPEWGQDVVYFGPTGCRTGCCLLLAGEYVSPCEEFVCLKSKSSDKKFKMRKLEIKEEAEEMKSPSVLELVKGMCQEIILWDDKIPGVSPEECGNYLDHNLLAAKFVAQNYLNVLSNELNYDQFVYPE